MTPDNPLRAFLLAQVHPSARRDPATAERHLAFMAPRLCGSVLALGTLPVGLAVRGVPGTLELLALAWMIAPIAIACYLSRTGRVRVARTLSALALAGLAAILAAGPGGIGALVAVVVVLVPLETALSPVRRAVAAALIAVAVAGLAVLLAALAGAWFGPLWPGGLPTAPGTLAGLLYGAGLALGAGGLVPWPPVRLRHGAQPLPAFAAGDVITHHGHDGRIVYASDNAQSVLGAPPGDLHGHGLFERIHVADRPAWLSALSQTAVTGAAGEIEFRLRRPGGGDFMWIEMRCRPFDDRTARHGEAAPGAVAVMRDVTARKARLDAALAAQAEARRANCAMSRFLALIGHELCSPLNAIIGFSDMLHGGAGQPTECARRREYARIISQSGRHLLAVVDHILDMSRLQTGHFRLDPEPVRLAAVIASCAELMAPGALQEGVVLQTEVAADLPEIVADRRALTQILINLIANAVRFSGRGKAVTVRALREGERVAIEIADTGTGMTPGDLMRACDPVGRRAAAGRRDSGAGGAVGAGSVGAGSVGAGSVGAGLGLSIVNGLVALHGGELEAVSERGRGTRMVVRLPVDCERAASGTVLGAADRRRDSPPAAASARDDLAIRVHRRA